MEWIGLALIGLGVLVVILVLVVGRRGPAPADPDTPPETADEPTVRSVTVEGDQVVVDFETQPRGIDPDHLASLLARAAVETVRGRSIDLDLGSKRITSVIATMGDPNPLSRVDFPDGQLPDPADIRVTVTEVTGASPLLERALPPVEGADRPVATAGVDELPPIGTELRIPERLRDALVARGVDPATADAHQLVRGLLAELGFRVDGDGETFLADRGTEKLVVHGVPHGPGEHPELAEGAVSAFRVALGNHPGRRGVLVTSKIVPFHVSSQQRPGIHLVGRQHLATFLAPFIDEFEQR